MELEESDLTKKKREGEEPKKESRFKHFIFRIGKLILIAAMLFAVFFLIINGFKMILDDQTQTQTPTTIQPSIQQAQIINGTTTSELITLFQAINQSGGIPINLKAETNWTQFFISLFLGSIFIVFIFGSMLSSSIKNLIMRSYFSFLKRKTGRHILFIKHTEQGLFSSSMIEQRTLNRVQKALIKFSGKPFDLILHTPGGEVFASMFISRLFKEYPGEIRAVIPMYAMSGGTLLALSADEIHMSPTACMGPVDPQLGNLFRYGSAKSWDHIVKFKGKKAEDQSISFAMMGNQYTQSIKNHLLNTISFNMDPLLKRNFVDFLTSGDVEHAFALTPTEMVKFGVPVKIIKDNNLLIKMIKYIVNSGNEGVTFI